MHVWQGPGSKIRRVWRTLATPSTSASHSTHTLNTLNTCQGAAWANKMAFRNVCKMGQCWFWQKYINFLEERQPAPVKLFLYSVSVVLGPLLIILGVCVKWAIFPPVVHNLVSQLMSSNSEMVNVSAGAQLPDSRTFEHGHLGRLDGADQPAAALHEVHLLQRRERWRDCRQQREAKSGWEGSFCIQRGADLFWRKTIYEKLQHSCH